ncbi:MAG: hypothetical protein K2W96_18125 [Gemmataceae bacterium]|nr:hypothetical protein [Gemmataceae bacterium]
MLDLGRHSDAQPVPPAVLEAAVLVPCVGLHAYAKAEHFRAEVRKSAGGYEVRVVPKGPVPVGEVKFDLELAPLDLRGERMPSRTVPVLGRVVPDLEPSLPDVHFGARPVGGTFRESVTLRSLSGRAFAVESVRAQGEGLAVEWQEVAGIGPTYQLTQRIVRKGAQGGKAVFAMRVGGKAVEVVVPVGYVGLEGGK